MLSLGEAKWGDVMGDRHVERLRRARDLLAAKGFDTSDTVIACYGGADFDMISGNDGVLSIGPERLLTGP